MINSKHIHLVGIGGIGMSGIAGILLKHGCSVSGSDMRPSDILDGLRSKGVEVFVGHNPDNIAPQTDLVVYSEAVRSTNPEIVAAEKRGIETIKYATCLGRLMLHYRGIAVAGTHGKTTTTAILVAMLRRAELDPTFVIGGEVPFLGGSSAIGESELFVAEACEYRRSFHNIHPEIAIINNIEEDHLDCYSGIEEIADAFGQFVRQIDENGLLVLNIDDLRSLDIARWYNGETTTFGFDPRADWCASEVSSSFGFTSFRLSYKGEPRGQFCLKMSGRHNVSNALAAIAVAHHLEVSDEAITQTLAKFPGVHRRFEEIGETDGVLVVDDYAHHPTAIRATLHAARLKYPERRVWCVFQPHQYSRTRFLMKDFARSFSEADFVIVPEIYFVRDSHWETEQVCAQDLVDKIALHGGDARFIPDFDAIMDFLAENMQPGDLLITMGAGDIDKISRRVHEHGLTKEAAL